MTDRQTITLTPDMLVALGCRPALAQKYAGHLSDTARRYGINNPLRLSHFLAQVLHESGRLRYTEEIASGEAYEGREDLGNTEPGDGRRFKGRGLIQLTGRANYSHYSRSVNIDFVSSPALVAELPHCVDVAGWYWQIKGMNRLADTDNLEAVTRRINGGLNGLRDRAAILTIARAQIRILAKQQESVVIENLESLDPQPIEPMPAPITGAARP